MAVTAPDAAAVSPFTVFASLKRLSPGGILIWATTLGQGHGARASSFPHARWPLRLSAFRVDHGWECQPAANVEQRLRWVAVGRWQLDVRVYFATQHPSKQLVADAQAELDRLLLPSAP